jgi:hypothetical protein
MASCSSVAVPRMAGIGATSPSTVRLGEGLDSPRSGPLARDGDQAIGAQPPPLAARSRLPRLKCSRSLRPRASRYCCSGGKPRPRGLDARNPVPRRQTGRSGARPAERDSKAPGAREIRGGCGVPRDALRRRGGRWRVAAGEIRRVVRVGDDPTPPGRSRLLGHQVLERAALYEMPPESPGQEDALRRVLQRFVETAARC